MGRPNEWGPCCYVRAAICCSVASAKLYAQAIQDSSHRNLQPRKTLGPDQIRGAGRAPPQRDLSGLGPNKCSYQSDPREGCSRSLRIWRQPPSIYAVPELSPMGQIPSSYSHMVKEATFWPPVVEHCKAWNRDDRECSQVSTIASASRFASSQYVTDGFTGPASSRCSAPSAKQ